MATQYQWTNHQKYHCQTGQWQNTVTYDQTYLPRYSPPDPISSEEKEKLKAKTTACFFSALLIVSSMVIMGVEFGMAHGDNTIPIFASGITFSTVTCLLSIGWCFCGSIDHRSAQFMAALVTIPIAIGHFAAIGILAKDGDL